ncbi:MarR family winged helix-turn-helix transcriptional regulator [Alicycliphilus sp. T452]
MISAKKLNQLRSTRPYAIGRLLLLARRDFVARLSARMEQDNKQRPPIPGGTLLPFIDLEGTRSADLARRVGISKQAVAKSVKEMEEAGLVTRTGDKADGRAFLVSFTELGMQYLLDIHAAITAIEKEYELLLGAQRMQSLREILAMLAYPEDSH